MFSKLVQEWVSALPTHLQKGVNQDNYQDGKGFVVDKDATLALMGLGAKLVGRVDCRALWFEDEAGNSLGFNVRSSILLHLQERGQVGEKDRGYPVKEYPMSRVGERDAKKLLGVEDPKPAKKEPEPKAVPKDEPKKNMMTAIVDHAVGPFAGGYALQIVFNDLESLVKAAKGLGIDRPKLETVASIVPAKEFMMPVHELGNRKEVELKPSAASCAVCGAPLTNRGRLPKHGFRFCMDPKCQAERNKFNQRERKRTIGVR